MKQELDEESRVALVAYRYERAEKTLEEANLLTENGFYNAAINRLYYACYYATEALLLKHKISAQTHAGVKTMFGMHFVTTKIVPLSTGKTLSTLFEKRQSGDYEDFVFCDRQEALDLAEQAKLFVSKIGELL